MWDESCGGSVFWEELSWRKKIGQYLTSDDMRRSHWCSRDHSWLAHDLPLISPKISPHTHTHSSISHHAPRPLSLSTPLFLELGTFRQAQNFLSSPPGDRFKIWAGLLGHGDRSNLLTAPLLSGVRPQWRCTTFTLVVTLHPGIRFPSFKPHLGARAIYLPCIMLCSSVSYSVALYHTL